MPELASLHRVNRGHLDVLSDSIGIMQHAIGSRPDPAHGYCTDDVARALEVDLLHARELGWSAVADSMRRNLRFLSEAFDATSGRFRNFRRADGSWLDEVGSEDSHGRATLALGLAVADAPSTQTAAALTDLFERALPASHGFAALRPHASVLLGCSAAAGAGLTGMTMLTARLMARRLRGAFAGQDAGWPWPEPLLTYENALPARALIVGGDLLGSRPLVDLGIRVLDWLIDAQTAPGGHLSPIGNGWWAKGTTRSNSDQQPIEATALLLAAESAYGVTHDGRYRMTMEAAYAWFLGRNDLGVSIADPDRGASRDGLSRRGANTNEGAESTLMWLIALEHVRALREPRLLPRLAPLALPPAAP